MATSFGHKLGRGLGVVGALALEGAVRGATGLGQFGADVVDGAELGYAERHAQLLVTREEKRVAALAAREALKLQHAVVMTPAPMAKAKARS